MRKFRLTVLYTQVKSIVVGAESEEDVQRFVESGCDCTFDIVEDPEIEEYVVEEVKDAHEAFDV